MNEKLALAILLILSLSIIMPGCIDSNNQNISTNWWEKEIFYYYIEIVTNETNNYLIYFPIPLISRVDNPKRLKPIKLMDELEVLSGDPNIQLIDTIYGYAIEINSTGQTVIQGHKIFENESTELDDDYAFNDLSLSTTKNKSSIKYAYLKSSNVDQVYISFDCYYKREHSRGGHNFEWKLDNYPLMNGWNKVEFETTWEISD